MIGATLKPAAAAATHRFGLDGTPSQTPRAAAGVYGVESGHADRFDGGGSHPAGRAGLMRVVPWFVLVAGYFAVAVSSYSQVAAEDAAAAAADARTCRTATLARGGMTRIAGIPVDKFAALESASETVRASARTAASRSPGTARAGRIVVMLPDGTCLVVED